MTWQQAVAVQGDSPPDNYWGAGEVAAVVAADAMDPAREAAAASGYGEEEALAYAAARMPACYAAVHRVLSELLQAAPPRWRPASVMDYGAGPGTATWAAQAVWPGAPALDVSAVEPSGAMSWLGHAIQQRQEEQYQQYQQQAAGDGAGGGLHAGARPAAGAPQPQKAADERVGGVGAEPPPVPPTVRWSSSLPPRSRGPGRRHDLVVAAYVLGELRGAGERRRIVTDLWRHTTKYLVLVEPGTPAGSLLIRQARQQVLAAAVAAIAPNGAAGEDAEAGAHVVAPCPHDGACPMEGRRSWCHFAQRFERTRLQRQSGAGGGRPAPRPYQDERFSYVVLARGPRPRATPQVRIAGAVPPAAGGQAAAAAYLSVPADLRPRRLEHLLEEGPAIARALSLGHESDGEGEDELGYESDGEGGEDEEDDAGPVVRESNALRGGEDEEDGDLDGAELAARAEDEAARRMILEAVRLDAEDEGADAGEVRQRLAELEVELDLVMRRERSERAAGARARAAVAGAPRERAAGSDSDELEEGAEYGEGGEAATAAARAASGGWSRLLRPPRARKGHVLLDLCSAAGAGGRRLDPGQGSLVRQVVAKGAAARATGGGAAFKLARRLRWGDLWPMDFQRRLPAVEPPDTGPLA
jgi:ribosomal protein RSM22 (predicted rRNA methylase)